MSYLYTGGNRTGNLTTRKYAKTGGVPLGTPEWSVDHGDTVFAIAVDSSGNVYTGGARTGNLTTRKYNSAGVLQWSVDHGTTARAIAVDKDGFVYTGGDRTSNLTTRKYNSAGTLQWSVDHGTNIYAIAVDKDGNVYTGGWRAGDNKTTRKYNSAGVEQWSVDHEASVFGIAVDADGNVYTGGTRTGVVTTRKYNSAGVEQWTADHGASAMGGVQGVAVDAGNVYTIAPPVGGVTTRKYTSDGNYIWGVACTGGGAVSAFAVAVDKDGFVYTGADRTSDLTTRKYNSAGTLQWSVDHGATVRCIDADPGRYGAGFWVTAITHLKTLVANVTASGSISRRISKTVSALVRVVGTIGRQLYPLPRPPLAVLVSATERSVTTTDTERSVTTEVILLPQMGNTVRLRAEFRTVADILGDPATVTLRLYDGARTLLTTVAHASITRVSAGIYQYDYTIPADLEGPLYYEFSGLLDGVMSLGRGGANVTWV